MVTASIHFHILPLLSWLICHESVFMEVVTKNGWKRFSFLFVSTSKKPTLFLNKITPSISCTNIFLFHLQLGTRWGWNWMDELWEEAPYLRFQDSDSSNIGSTSQYMTGAWRMTPDGQRSSCTKSVLSQNCQSAMPKITEWYQRHLWMIYRGESSIAGKPPSWK